MKPWQKKALIWSGVAYLGIAGLTYVAREAPGDRMFDRMKQNVEKCEKQYRTPCQLLDDGTARPMPLVENGTTVPDDVVHSKKPTTTTTEALAVAPQQCWVEYKTGTGQEPEIVCSDDLTKRPADASYVFKPEDVPHVQGLLDGGCCTETFGVTTTTKMKKKS